MRKDTLINGTVKELTVQPSRGLGLRRVVLTFGLERPASSKESSKEGSAPPVTVRVRVSRPLATAVQTNLAQGDPVVVRGRVSRAGRIHPTGLVNRRTRTTIAFRGRSRPRPFFQVVAVGIGCYGLGLLGQTYQILTHHRFDPTGHIVGVSAVLGGFVVGFILLLGLLLRR